MARNYVGLAVTFHDPALAIVNSRGEVTFAEASERHLQVKRALFQPPDDLAHIASLVERYCEPGAELVVAHSWLRRQWRSVLARGYFAVSRDRTSPLLLPQMVGQANAYDLAGLNLAYRVFEDGTRTLGPTRHFDHHLTHAAAACHGSPFDEAVCAVIDGHGETGPQSFFHYREGRLETLHRIERRRRENVSLGFYYANLCLMCGFDPLKGEEWKVMGLAPYGKKDEALYAKLRPLFRVEGLNLLGDNNAVYDAMMAERLPRGEPALAAADRAFTGQLVFNDVCAALLGNLFKLGRSRNLVLTGGCALNSSWNGKILDSTGFGALHVPSAPADDGNAVGAALLAYQEDHPPSRAPAVLRSAYLGESVSGSSIDSLMEFGGLKDALPPGVPIHQRAAELLAAGRILGWVQGRAEFGPRALGNRSILADPRSPSVKETLNARVKFREEFRPFAPSILHEHGPDYFEHYQESPFMERALRFKPEVAHKVPGVVHVDGTGRLQSVRREYNPRFYELISAFHALTGVPLLLNTSFNVMGKPIVHSVEDAVAVFFTSGLDALVLGDRLFVKG